MNNFNDLLKKYAELTIKIGINIQKNQALVIKAPIECAEFVRLATSYAYENGASNVYIKWCDDELTRIKYLKAPYESFKEFPKWEVDFYETLAKEGAAFLSISGSNPELLNGIDPEKISISNKTSSLALQEYTKYIMNSTVSWCVICLPTKGWAKKVYPTLSEDKALERLWKSIFKIVRINENNPVQAWRKHLDNLESKTKFLNEKNIKSLHYLSKDTDLTIELPENYIWAGGGEYDSKNVYFVANMPTEEIFTLPLKTGVNGVVKSTKPLNFHGNLIDNFKLTFKEGKVVDFSAEKGYETLKKLIENDEGSAYLGEVALVPHDSPISNSNTIFYNTLFDENASCHLAFGMAYPICLKNGENMNEEELKLAGANSSLLHVDFMIGSKDLNITATTKDGNQIEIFKNGNWAF